MVLDLDLVILCLVMVAGGCCCWLDVLLINLIPMRRVVLSSIIWIICLNSTGNATVKNTAATAESLTRSFTEWLLLSIAAELQRFDHVL